MDKPPISADTFTQLGLQVGTVLSTEANPDLPSLSVVEVELGRSIEAVAPTMSLPKDLVGRQVVVTGPFYPLVVGSESYTYSLLMESFLPGNVLIVAERVPDGSRLY